MRMEGQPAKVPEQAKQAGEAEYRWFWVEPSVWTDRMLATLVSGVKGGKWFSLIDKVYAPRNLESAFWKVRSNKGAAGVDHQTVEMFEADLDANLGRLSRSLEDGTYQPNAVRRAWIPKPGGKEKRPLGIPTVRDRVAQTALRQVIEPIFECDFAPPSYGFRPGRSCKDALREVAQLLKDGYRYVVDADLKSYFDTIPHDRLMAQVEAKVSDGKVLKLIRAYLNQGVLEEMKTWTPEEGTPQGAVVSPLLANIYLNPLDHEMAARGFQMIRYADDFVVLCRTPEEAENALKAVQAWTEKAGLTLHPEKTRIVDLWGRGFVFLGYQFWRHTRWPRKKSIAKLRDTIRKKTCRSNGHSLQAIIREINPVLRGWFAYFQHSNRRTFRPIDQWVRTRLRTILRKRSGRSGVSRGEDLQRWNLAFFAEQGLYSLCEAHALTRQSALR